MRKLSYFTILYVIFVGCTQTTNTDTNVSNLQIEKIQEISHFSDLCLEVKTIKGAFLDLRISSDFIKEDLQAINKQTSVDLIFTTARLLHHLPLDSIRITSAPIIKHTPESTMCDGKILESQSLTIFVTRDIFEACLFRFHSKITEVSQIYDQALLQSGVTVPSKSFTDALQTDNLINCLIQNSLSD